MVATFRTSQMSNLYPQKSIIMLSLQLLFRKIFFKCSAGPEVAVIDWYGPEADPVYWQRGRGGGNGRTPGILIACEAHRVKVLGHPPRKNPGI